MQARSDRLVSALSEVAERHGATARRIPGGGVIAVFGVPELHEDDALRALRAAVEMRDALAAMPERSALRVGVDSGEVFAHEAVAADLPATGAPVTSARRLEQLAPVGEIVFGAATLRLVRGAVGAAPVRGRSRRPHEPAAFRLVGLVAGAPAIAHWAEATLLDFAEYLGSHVAGAALLVVCLARPELLEERPGWPALQLAPLEEEHTRELLDVLAGDDTETASLCVRIAEIAEGNPLYAEQLLAYATEGGELGSVPPTLELLLASRLDRLPLGERRVLQRAAAVGREFTRAALAAVAPSDVDGELDVDLAALTRRGLLRATGADDFR